MAIIRNRKFVKVPVFNWCGYDNQSDLSNTSLTFPDTLNFLSKPYTYTQDYLADILDFSLPEVSIAEYYLNRTGSPVSLINRIGVTNSSNVDSVISSICPKLIRIPHVVYSDTNIGTYNNRKIYDSTNTWLVCPYVKGDPNNYSDKSDEIKNTTKSFDNLHLNFQYYIPDSNFSYILLEQTRAGSTLSGNELFKKYNNEIVSLGICLIEDKIILSLSTYDSLIPLSFKIDIDSNDFPILLDIDIYSLKVLKPTSNSIQYHYNSIEGEGTNTTLPNNYSKDVEFYKTIEGSPTNYYNPSDTYIEIKYKPANDLNQNFKKFKIHFSNLDILLSTTPSSCYIRGDSSYSPQIKKYYDKNLILATDNSSTLYYDSGSSRFVIGFEFGGLDIFDTLSTYETDPLIGSDKSNVDNKDQLISIQASQPQYFIYDIDSNMPNYEILNNNYKAYINLNTESDQSNYIYLTNMSVSRYIDMLDVSNELSTDITVKEGEDLEQDLLFISIDIAEDISEDLMSIGIDVAKDITPVDIPISIDAARDLEQDILNPITIQIREDVEQDLLNPITISIPIPITPVDPFTISITVLDWLKSIAEIEDYINKTYLGSQQAADDFQLLFRVTDTSYWPVEYTIDTDYHIHIKPDPMYIGVELYACTNKQFLYCKYDMMNI